MINDEEELRMYILVNKDVKMSKGKIAAQVGHACTTLGVQSYNNDKFNDWFNNVQKKIILKSSQELLEKLEKENYIAIRDAGLTEVKSNTLTCVTLGITSYNDVEHIVKDLPLL